MPKLKKYQKVKIPFYILVISQILQVISKRFAAWFAANLFVTPIRYKMPKREFEMDRNTNQKWVYIATIQKEIRVYEYGKSEKRILLVHGWSGRATQLVKIAQTFLDLGYSTVSYDAPGHGKSPGRTSDMRDFIEINLELEKIYGSFEYAIGHSLGGMALLNSIKSGLSLKKAVVVSSGDIIDDIIADFIFNINMTPLVGLLMKDLLEKRFGETMDNYSSYIAARSIEIPVFIIHDENDQEVSVKAAYHIHKNLKGSKIVITKNLGHRKILGDYRVIEKIVNFINT